MAEPGERIAANPETAFEPKDWPLGAIGLSLLGIFVFLVVAPLVMIWAFPGTLGDVDRRLSAMPPGPRLQIDPAKELAQFRAGENRRLETYYWVDKEKGVVHIPIEEVMKKLAAQGIDGFPKGQP